MAKRAAANGSGAAWAVAVHRVFRESAIRQVGYVPDAGLSRLITLCETDSEIRDVVLATEEEGVALMAGAWLGGQRGALLMQSSGIGNCINVLSMVSACAFPLMMLVTMRGEWGETNPWQVPMGQSAARHLELAGVIVYPVIRAEEVGETVAQAAQLVFSSSRAAAVLISQRVIGAKVFVGDEVKD